MHARFRRSFLLLLPLSLLSACAGKLLDGDGAGTTGTDGSICGDGVVEADELCDGGEGCTEDCELSFYVCNPMNQVGCFEPTQTCDRTRGATLADQRTGCFQDGRAGYKEACEYNPYDPNLQCADGYSCVGASFVPGCEGLVECCTPFCIIGGEPKCPEPGQECLSWKEPGMPPGLDDLGLCIAL